MSAAARVRAYAIRLESGEIMQTDGGDWSVELWGSREAAEKVRRSFHPDGEVVAVEVREVGG